ncbi:MAG: histidine phosphatase family protein [Pseudomonadota bacterium]
MLRLLLLRHAKSAWDDPTLADHDRPLADRGRKAARVMAGFLAEHELVPGRILCSTAQRTRETLSHVVPMLSGETEIRLTRKLYEADGGDYMTAIREGGAAAPMLMLIGHNPTMEDTAQLLAGAGERSALVKMREKFPTCALAVIDFDIASWRDIGPGAGRLTQFVTPRLVDPGHTSGE